MAMGSATQALIKKVNGIMVYLGIDLGGTKIEIIALDKQGQTLLRKRIKTPKESYQAILLAIAELVHQTEKQLGQVGTLGIGTPGSLSPKTGLLRNSNTVLLNGRPFKTDLEAILARPVPIENDANCFALSEAVDGAGEGAASVFGVIIGTGTGAGIVIQGKVLTGVNAIAGEWGHNPLPWPQPNELPGLDCYCGKKGCIETWLSGPGLARHFYLDYHKSMDARQIVAASEQGDPEAERALQTYEDRLARGLSHVINILDPEVIVLGGGLSNIQRLYKNVPKIWGNTIFSDCVCTRLLPPKHGDSSGVRGAAWLGIQ